jgi:hypothetical protein
VEGVTEACYRTRRLLLTTISPAGLELASRESRLTAPRLVVELENEEETTPGAARTFPPSLRRGKTL